MIHFHAEGPCSMLPLARLFSKKCVATIHGLDWQRAKWGGFATRFLLFGERMAVKYADCVIVLSKGVQQYFMDTYHKETVFIPNGIEEKENKEPDIISRKYELRGNDYLLFLARLVPEKGVHLLLEAYEKSGIRIPLVIAGGSSHSGEYEKQLMETANRMNSHSDTTGQKIIMTGFVQGQELEELYSNCLLYILPSEIEGMPISLLEAMSYGCLCLTSDILENTDVTAGHGLCFQTKDTEDLSRKLKNIIYHIDSLRAQIPYQPENIKKSVLERFNWEQIVKRTLQCYENINRK